MLGVWILLLITATFASLAILWHLYDTLVFETENLPRFFWALSAVFLVFAGWSTIALTVYEAFNF